MNKKKANPVGRPKRSDKDNTKVPSSEVGTKPGDKRKTYIVSQALDDKIQAVAYWDRISIKEVVQEAFTKYLSDWEKKNGKVKPIPSK